MGGAYEKRNELSTGDVPPPVLRTMGRPEPTPGGVVQESVNVAPGSDGGRLLLITETTFVQGYEQQGVDGAVHNALRAAAFSFACPAHPITNGDLHTFSSDANYAKDRKRLASGGVHVDVRTGLRSAKNKSDEGGCERRYKRGS